MTTILLLACAGLISGSFILLRLKPLDFTDGVFQMLTGKPKSLRSELKETVGKKKPNILKREILDAQTVLAMTGRSRIFPLVCAASLFCFVGGAVFAMMLGNIFLVPVMATGMMFLPFWYVKLMANNYKKEINTELETALSIITTAYLRCEDIITAVDENIEYLNPPAKAVFADFLSQVRLINPDIEAALRVMRTRIDNDVFREWVDAIAACQHDRSLKTTLIPVVAKLSDIRVVNAELDFLIFEPRKEFITMIMDEYKRGRMKNILKAAGIRLTPEEYMGYAYVKSGLTLLGAILCLFVLPLLSPVFIFLAIAIYFRETRRADEQLKAIRERIDSDLPRFVMTIEQEIRTSRDVLGIFENYKKNAGEALRHELDIVCADMRSSSYEAALTRFEARFNSPQLSDVVRGLIGVLRGDNGAMYFKMLAHDFKLLELQKLKKEAQKIPPKIRKYSFFLLMVFLFTYLTIIVVEIITSLGNLF